LDLQFSLFDLLILIGIIQGIITSILLLNTDKNKISNRFLALGLLSFCLLSTKPLLHTLSLWDTHIFRYFPNALELAVAPLIFFYIKSLLTPKFHFKAKYWLHFVPFFISQIYSLIVYFLVVQTNDSEKKDSIAKHLLFDEVKQLDEYILLLATIAYLYYGYSMLINYREWLNNTTSDSSLPDFKWLKNIFLLFSLTGIILLISRILSLLSILEYINIGNYLWQFLSLYMAFLIYYLGLRGYLQPHYSFPEELSFNSKKLTIVHSINAEAAALIQKSMEEDKLFLDTKLSISSLASQLGISQREISTTINHHFNSNFRDYINNYRVEEVKNKLSHSDLTHMSLLGVALESGFNSEASFYRLFKKHTGITPKEYLQQETSNQE
jgi:AraC-like DNA-binding protein